MDTRFLETFVAVVDHGSLAEAARRLNITSAAVAQRLRALETEFGTALIARSGRMVRPTAAGIAILDRTRGFLLEVRDIKSIATNTRIAGELRIGAIGTALTGIMPEILKRLIDSYPDLDFYLEASTSADLFGRVADGTLDAAVMVRPQFKLPKALSVKTLRSEELIVLAPKSAEGQDPFDLLRTQPFIRYDRKNWGGRLANDFLLSHAIEPNERFELDALDAIAVMVGAGLGVSLVPDWGQPWPVTAPLVKMPLAEPRFNRDIVLVWLTRTPRARLLEVLIKATGA
jgi:DNA-binding transcriptional LysR family regulator